MPGHLAAIIQRLISSEGDRPALSGCEAAAQFDPDDNQPTALARSLNAAFLLALAGQEPLAGQARDFLSSARGPAGLGRVAAFLEEGLKLIGQEVSRAVEEDPDLAGRMARVRAGLDQEPTPSGETLRLLWEIFFPEGLSGLGDRGAAVEKLRQRRSVRITAPNPRPLTDPAREVLFTANVLLTVPQVGKGMETLDLGPELTERLRKASQEEQLYWYDHPMPVGAAPNGNEFLYGLKGLSDALAFERARRPEWADRRLCCLLSVSVTHQGLKEPGREYLNQLLRQAEGLDGLEISLFSETETDRLKAEILLPAAKRYFPEAEAGLLNEIIGVDGEYGRHYSFLKAAAAWWQVLINSRVKATFKIDLDQVFPQEELVAQAGASAFESLTTPLWGARGRDWQGEEVELGLLAGALVNKSDISQGIFTPDVPWPDQPPQGDEVVFFSPLPQALSTEAEMMCRYGAVNGGDDAGRCPDGRTACLQRIHVTGGTTGVLVESLRRHRPFTPTFIGRAEDQAYLLSVLFDRQPSLRYLHQPGLIMRHDKAALIPEAISAARTGKIIGDYARLLWFSQYARALPWPLRETKAAIDPFTGCFVSGLPLSVVILRLTLKAARLFGEGRPESEAQAVELLEQGSRRLSRIIRLLQDDPQALARRYQMEKQGWDLFYDILDRLEEGLAKGDPFALEIQAKARKIAQGCSV